VTSFDVIEGRPEWPLCRQCQRESALPTGGVLAYLLAATLVEYPGDRRRERAHDEPDDDDHRRILAVPTYLEGPRTFVGF